MLFYMRNYRVLMKAKLGRRKLDAEWRTQYCPSGHKHELSFNEDEHGIVLECGRCEYFSYVGPRH